MEQSTPRRLFFFALLLACMLVPRQRGAHEWKVRGNMGASGEATPDPIQSDLQAASYRFDGRIVRSYYGVSDKMAGLSKMGTRGLFPQKVEKLTQFSEHRYRFLGLLNFGPRNLQGGVVGLRVPFCWVDLKGNPENPPTQAPELQVLGEIQTSPEMRTEVTVHYSCHRQDVLLDESRGLESGSTPFGTALISAGSLFFGEHQGPLILIPPPPSAGPVAREVLIVSI